MWKLIAVCLTAVCWTSLVTSESTCEPFGLDDCEFTGSTCGWDLHDNFHFEQNHTNWYIVFDRYSPSSGNLTSKRACSTNGTVHCLTLRYLMPRDAIICFSVFVKENGAPEELLWNVSFNSPNGEWNEDQVTLQTTRDFEVIIRVEKLNSSNLNVLLDSVNYTKSPCMMQSTTKNFGTLCSLPKEISSKSNNPDSEIPAIKVAVIIGVVAAVIVVIIIIATTVGVVVRRKHPRRPVNCCMNRTLQNDTPATETQNETESSKADTSVCVPKYSQDSGYDNHLLDVERPPHPATVPSLGGTLAQDPAAHLYAKVNKPKRAGNAHPSNVPNTSEDDPYEIKDKDSMTQAMSTPDDDEYNKLSRHKRSGHGKDTVMLDAQSGVAYSHLGSENSPYDVPKGERSTHSPAFSGLQDTQEAASHTDQGLDGEYNSLDLTAKGRPETETRGRQDGGVYNHLKEDGPYNEVDRERRSEITNAEYSHIR